MRQTSNHRILAVASLTVLVVAGCAAGETEEEEEENSAVECTVDRDCPGPTNTCDLETHTCTGAVAEEGDASRSTFDAPSDTSRPRTDSSGGRADGSSDDSGSDDVAVGDASDGSGPDGSEEDVEVSDSGGETSVPDTSSDSGAPDSGSVDTRAPDTTTMDTGATDTRTGDTNSTDTGGGVDAGHPFSGCTADSDCTGLIECNKSLGRCEDPRPTCTSSSDCGSSAYCVAGRCASSCEFSSCPSGTTCDRIGGSGGPEVCIARCTSFAGSGSRICGPDTQCIPIFGSEEGVCRGVGRNRLGERCTDVHGPSGCREGSICISNRGERRCRSLCAATSAPSCGARSYCAVLFETNRSGNDASNPAGYCRDNCGGLGNTNDGLCRSGQLCQPESATRGYCTPQGSAGPGAACGSTGAPYCEVGNYCLPTQSQNQGICRGACDPAKLASNNVCSASQTCFEIEQGFGFCVDMCSNTGGQTIQCPVERPYCAAVASGTTSPSTPGVCLDSAP